MSKLLEQEKYKTPKQSKSKVSLESLPKNSDGLNLKPLILVYRAYAHISIESFERATLDLQRAE